MSNKQHKQHNPQNNASNQNAEAQSQQPVVQSEQEIKQNNQPVKETPYVSDYSYFANQEIDYNKIKKVMLREVVSGEIIPSLHVKYLENPESDYAEQLSTMILAKTKESPEKYDRPKEADQLVSDLDRELFPGRVIVGWDNLYDTNKVLIPYSLEECKKFCTKGQGIPGFLWERIRKFVANIDNFREVPDILISSKEAEKLLGNSSKDSDNN